MKSILCATAAAVTLAQDLPTFESFVEVHARSYQRGSAEFGQRKALYEQRVADAEKQNSSPDKKWKAGVNKLWDWTDNEMQSLFGWDGSAVPEGHHSSRAVAKHSSFLQQDDTKDLPKEKIWDDLETFAYTKDQANCGSCWAIASATVLEAHNEIYNKKHTVFSTQQIVDCTPNPRHCGGEGGCKGATAGLAMDWVLKNGLIEASERPYTAQDGACIRTTNATADKKVGLLAHAPAASKGGAAFGMTGWSMLKKNTYEPLLRALALMGPVVVSVGADQWFMYEGGIFNGCGKDNVVNHAVVAVGYGEEEGTPFWVIQNSWGQDWGENGQIRLERHIKGDYCGMNNDPQKGSACKGETKPVPVCGMCGVLFDSVVPHFKGSIMA
jgi:cathepsin L